MAAGSADFDVFGGNGGFGLYSLSSDGVGDPAFEERALMNIGFGGTGGLVFSGTDAEFGLRGSGGLSSTGDAGD